MVNLLSIDFESWFHFLGDPSAPKREQWHTLDARLEKNTNLLLEALDGLSVTFFVLGWVGEYYPEIVKKIFRAGHEIACHGYYHDLIFKLGPQKFRDDIKKAKALLEDITGKAVLGYRAPGFSIRKSEPWALEIIYEEGFKYDSSIFPALRTMGGIDGFNRFPQIMKLKAGELIELPVSTTLLFDKPIVFCGGGFFRFCPYWFMKREITQLNQANIPAVVYLHPQDFDPGQPRMKLTKGHYFLYYYGLHKALKKFKKLLSDFQWRGFAAYAKSNFSQNFK